MDQRDSQDLDRVIDEVARAMTSVDVPRDLRPAVAARIASAPPWSFGWRVAAAGAAVAAVVIGAVVLRTGSEPQNPRPVAGGGVRAAITPPPIAAPAEAPPRAATARDAGAVRQVARAAVRRQTIVGVAAVVETVAIDPVAIVPLDADGPSPPQLVQIKPIEFMPVRISEFDRVE
jgi:hypothetical protein